MRASPAASSGASGSSLPPATGMVAALAVSMPASAFASWLKLCTHQSVASRRSTGRAAGTGASSCTGRRGSAVGGSLASNTTPASTSAAGSRSSGCSAVLSAL